MASGANLNAPAGDGQDDNIVNEQPIEISSESSNEGSEMGSDSEVSIISSLGESSDSHGDQKLEDEFAAILAKPSKRYKQYMDLCTTAFKLNVFDKIEVAIKEFGKYATIPSHIWLRYLKTLKVVTQTPAERIVYEEKCGLALASYYDEQLAEFVVKDLMEQPLVAQLSMWSKLLADYCLDRADLVDNLREQLGTLSDKTEMELVEKTMKNQCVTWNCDTEELQAIKQLIEEFKLKLRSSTENSSWLQEMFILKADTMSLDDNIKCTLAKLFYERCLTKYPTDSSLWLGYIAYMQKNVETGTTGERYTLVNDGYLKCKPLEIIRRALLTKPTAALNHKYLQLMEQYELSLERVDEELKRHFDRIVPYMEMTVELHLDYLAYRVRNTKVEDEEQVKGLREAFRQVWDRLSELYGDDADTNFEVMQLWAQVEYAKLSSPEKGAAVWTEIFSYPGTNVKSHLWLAYAQMESEYNGGLKTTTVLRQALMALSMTPNVHVVAEHYRRIERCFGTNDSLSDCRSYCEAYMPVNTPGILSRPPSVWAQSKRAVPMQTQQKAVKKSPPTRQLPIAKKEMPPPKKPAASAPAPAAAPNEPKEPNFKYSPHLEANKVFVKNLYPRCTKEVLGQAFKSFGTILDVRLVYKLNQKFKGIAYIEFSKPEEAKKAVMCGDGMDIGGQKIVVAISNPPPKPVAGSSTAPAATGAPRQPEKRRMPTSLIPTKLVINEVKRRKKLELDEDAAVSSSADANGNGKTGDANGKETVKNKDSEPGNESETSEQLPPPAPKSNDDFRKLFNI